MRGAIKVDGNAIAGMLSDIFVGDVTTMSAGCRGCGATSPLAETVVERDDRAAIVRCRSCTMTLFTLLCDVGGTRFVVGALREVDMPPLTPEAR